MMFLNIEKLYWGEFHSWIVFYWNIKLRVINLYTLLDNTATVRIFRKVHELLMVGYFTVVCVAFNAYTD